MSCNQEVTYALDFRAGGRRARDSKASRIARLMALAIRFERMVEDGTITDYAELARRGHVTRARMSQLMKLPNLAPDIQEHLFFLTDVRGINERNLRPIVSQTGWHEQRLLFALLCLKQGQ
jgi:hypothetical protein